MYDDIIDGNNQICSACWWSTGKTIATVGHAYCSLYKKEYDEKYRCGSWRKRYTMSLAEAEKYTRPKVKYKFNLKGA